VIPSQNRTLVSPRLYEHLGTMEQAIVEQIELIDSEKKEELSYEEMNSILSTRIYYNNLTMDQCIDHLLKNL
jgi:hypothetical protein